METMMAVMVTATGTTAATAGQARADAVASAIVAVLTPDEGQGTRWLTLDAVVEEVWRVWHASRAEQAVPSTGEVMRVLTELVRRGVVMGRRGVEYGLAGTAGEGVEA